MTSGNRPALARPEAASRARAPVRIGLLGASGFLGAHVCRRGRSGEVDVVPIAGPRVDRQPHAGAETVARRWVAANGDAFDSLCTRLAGFDVVINAAGMAAPRSADVAALEAANTVQPVVVARACARAGVRRLVHVSTAAVQGRMDPLDETARHLPFSPYTRTKAAAERHLLDTAGERPSEVVVYRPTSVLAPERGTTRLVARVAAAPIVPVVAEGHQPLPFALVDNVAAGILFAAATPVASPIVVQPDEGMTTRDLLSLFGARRLVPLAAGPVRSGLSGIRRCTTGLPSLSTAVRGLELLLLGQRVAESSLTRAGFVPPAGREAWQALARSARGTGRRGPPAAAPPGL